MMKLAKLRYTKGKDAKIETNHQVIEKSVRRNAIMILMNIRIVGIVKVAVAVAVAVRVIVGVTRISNVIVDAIMDVDVSVINVNVGAIRGVNASVKRSQCIIIARRNALSRNTSQNIVRRNAFNRNASQNIVRRNAFGLNVNMSHNIVKKNALSQ